MVAMSAADRVLVKALIVADLNSNSESWGVTKAEMDTLITDVDAFVDGEVPTNLNAGLTTSLNAKLSDAQELKLMEMVCKVRREEAV